MRNIDLGFNTLNKMHKSQVYYWMMFERTYTCAAQSSIRDTEQLHHPRKFPKLPFTVNPWLPFPKGNYHSVYIHLLRFLKMFSTCGLFRESVDGEVAGPGLH